MKMSCQNAWTTYFDDYEFNRLQCQHCTCYLCTIERSELNLPLCVNNTCQGCQNKLANKRVFNWIHTMEKYIDQKTSPDHKK